MSVTEKEPKTYKRPVLTGQQIVVSFLLLMLFVAFGSYLRFVGQDWDEGQLLHPDERFMTTVASAVQVPESFALYMDTRLSTLNPNNMGHAFYVYGNLPLTIVRSVAELLEMTTYFDIYLVGRTVVAASDLLTIVIIYFIGKRLFSYRAGLLAAGLYSVAALPIQLSHFWTVDPIANLFTVLAFYFAVRALDEHNWLTYSLFGISLGMAMGSKISIAPMALILALAIGSRIIEQTKASSKAREHPETAFTDTRFVRRVVMGFIGLSVAGIFTILVFRLSQPYAFLPPLSGEPIDPTQIGFGMQVISHIGDPFGFRPNPEWLRQMREVSWLVSGNADIPPNHQWAQRPPLIYPLSDMLRAGLGLPLGIFSWFAVLWGVWEIARQHEGSRRLVLPVTWTLLIFLWQGSGWVMTMRYFLPIYPFLALLSGWALVTLWDRVDGLVKRYEVGAFHWSRVSIFSIASVVIIGAAAWGFAVTRIYTRPVTRVEASRWIIENVPSDATIFVESGSDKQTYQIGFWDNWVSNPSVPPPPPGEEDITQPTIRQTVLNDNVAYTIGFDVEETGGVQSVRLNHVLDPFERETTKTVVVSLSTDFAGTNVISEGTIQGVFDQQADDLRGVAYEVNIEPVILQGGNTYYLAVEVTENGPLQFGGSVIANEDVWDDALPLRMTPYDAWSAMYHSMVFNVVWDDTPDKRERFQYILDHTDYIVISSNRFYDSLTRNPRRWPMTIDYYEALFSGELGFDLVADFTSRPNLGPIEFKDDDVDEAWTVYDHPRVFIFKKSNEYSSAVAAEILNQADLDAVVSVAAPDARGRPVDLPIPEPIENQSIQVEVSDSSLLPAQDDSPPTDFYTRFQSVAAVLWWLLIAALGLIAFPILYVLLPGLTDAGYAISRIFGLLFLAWGGWMLASLGVMHWGAGALLTSAAVLVVASGWAAYTKRAQIIEWFRQSGTYLTIFETLLLTLYLGFVLVRVGNPDLWHPVFGGEKPMDLAYFNAVLQSETFPPYDPWFSGDSINYYYFGFVLAGVPVVLLNMPATLAYNLIIPTLFALTGAGAFSAAYNLISKHAPVPAEDVPQYAASIGAASMLGTIVLGNLSQVRTYLYGLAELGSGESMWAFKLVPNVVDIINGFLITLEPGRQLPIATGEWYWNATRMMPVPLSADNSPTEIQPITEFPLFTFLYADLHAHMIALPIGLFVLTWAIGLVHSAGENQPKWYWHVLALPLGALGVGALIATNTWDIPTYLLLGVGAVLASTILRQQDAIMGKAAVTATLLAGVFGAGYYFVALQSAATQRSAAEPITLINTAALALLVFVLTYALVAMLGHLQTRSESAIFDYVTVFASAAAQVGLFVGLTVLMFLPYIQNYETGYSAFLLWQGSETAVWAYLVMFGLFLFIISTWLLAELSTWFSELGQQKTKTGRSGNIWLLGLLGAIGLVTVLAGLALSQVALITVPLLATSIMLLYRPGLVRSKQIVLCLVALAGLISLAVDVFVLQGDLGRMNTVFKFYLQVWILLAVSAAAALGWLIPMFRSSSLALKGAWYSGLGVLIALAALYPLTATPAKIADRWNPNAPRTLDGMVYMNYVQRGENNVYFQLNGDYEAITWLQQNVEGTPTLLEAHTTEYRWGARMSIYTGYPAVIGWNWHQRQQRPDRSAEVFKRVDDVQLAYITQSPAMKLQIIDEYGIDVIVVGELEHALYGESGGLEIFDVMAEVGQLDVLYQEGNTTLYGVPNEAGR